MENINKLKTLPWKLNVEAMKIRCNKLPTPFGKIAFLLNLMTLKNGGIIHLTDLIQIIRVCDFDSSSWHSYITWINTEEHLFMFAQLAGFAGQCKVLENPDDLRESINIHLEHIYRNEK